MEIQLQYPLKHTWIVQKFGDNMLAIYKNNGMEGHNGVDFGAVDGTPVYASHDGTAYTSIDASGGNGVTIESYDKYEIFGETCRIKTIYWHLKENNPCVKWGQKVKTGDLIGYADNTGYSTGSHLHFALKPFSGVANLFQNNGYKGAIDPMPYLSGYPDSNYVFTKTLRYGMWNTDVYELQRVLQKKPYYTGALDGSFGPLTKKAVKQFQSENWLYPDGIVGPKTNKKLNELK